MKAVAEDLVTRAQAGDAAAFRALVDLHARDVFRLAFRITRNEEDAEDTVQEAFLRAYRKLDGFESRATFGTWLYRVTTNTAIDILRKRRRTGEREPSLEVTTVDSGTHTHPEQEGAVFGRQVRERVDIALEGLTEMERSAFVLRHLQELPLAEISESLGISVNSTKQALFRAVRKLRKCLEPLVGTQT